MDEKEFIKEVNKLRLNSTNIRMTVRGETDIYAVKQDVDDSYDLVNDKCVYGLSCADLADLIGCLLQDYLSGIINDISIPDKELMITDNDYIKRRDVLNLMAKFEAFISKECRQATDHNVAIYEHWIDCYYDTKNLPVFEADKSATYKSEECPVHGLIGDDHCENDAMQKAINIIERLKAEYEFFSKSDLIADKNIAQILDLIINE